jgi:hypothetical protein
LGGRAATVYNNQRSIEGQRRDGAGREFARLNARFKRLSLASRLPGVIDEGKRRSGQCAADRRR